MSKILIKKDYSFNKKSYENKIHLSDSNYKQRSFM